MAERIWKIQGNTGTHTVRLEHAYLSGRATVFVDGKTIFHRHRQIADDGLNREFEINGVRCLLRVTCSPWCTFWYTLRANGEKQKPA
jgi:hypothetical protein